MSLFCLHNKQNENDPTILSEWRRVVPVEDFFDAISEIHCKQKGHIGSKKTINEVNIVDINRTESHQ